MMAKECACLRLTFLDHAVVGLKFLHEELCLLSLQRRIKNLIQTRISLLIVDEVSHLLHAQVVLALGSTRKEERELGDFSFQTYASCFHVRPTRKLSKYSKIRRLTTL